MERQVRSPVSYPPPLPTTRGFRLRWYTLTLLVFLTTVGAARAALIFLGTPRAGLTPEQSGELMGRILGELTCPAMFSLIIGTITFFIARRSTMALNIAMTVALGFIFLSYLGTCLRALK